MLTPLSHRIRRHFPKIVILVVSCILSAVVAEGAWRVYAQHKFGTGFWDSPSRHRDDVLGWSGKVLLGESNTTKKKVLIVGDSFTDGMGVEEEKMYYSYLKQYADVELFVLSGKGYGTLQEYLLLDAYFDEVQPDIVLLQMSTNDVVNNSLQLEKQSALQNSLHMKPFLHEGEIIQAFPTRGGKIRVFLSDHSRLLYQAFLTHDQYVAALAISGQVGTVEKRIVAEGKRYQPYQEALDITGQLLQKFKSRANGALFIVFLADDGEPIYTDLTALFRKEEEVPYITSVARTMQAARELERPYFLEDGGHWNEEGHRQVGKALSWPLLGVLRDNTD